MDFAADAAPDPFEDSAPELATPPFQAPLPEVPMPPPLIPDPAELERLMGGKPIPMRVGRPGTSPAPAEAAPEPSPAPVLSPTFSGAAANPALSGKIAEVRRELGRVISMLTDLETRLPALLDAIDREAEDARRLECFDVEEATAFYMDLMDALATTRA
jgi:hypothetical protein